MSRERPETVLVVGASAAGLRCASRLKRLRPEWRVVVIEQREVFSYAACGLPYYLSGDIEDATALWSTAWGRARDREYFERVKGLEMLNPCRAVAIDAAGRRLQVQGATGRRWLDYDHLVLACGARARRLAMVPEHERVHTFHTLEDARVLHELLVRGQLGSVVVAGAGPVGCELAEAFTALWGVEVTLLEAADWPLPGLVDEEVGRLVRARLQANGVDCRCGAPLDEVEVDEGGVRVRAGGREYSAERLVVAVGVEPEVELARQAGCRLSPGGAIAVDEHLATSVPGIWAVGDCVALQDAVLGQPCQLPLGSLANRQGRVLANLLAGGDDAFGAVVGAAVVKVFDWQVAVAGHNLTSCRRAGLEAQAAWYCGHDRAHYFPGHDDLFVQLVYRPADGRLLGVQAAGLQGAVKLIDQAAAMLQAGADLRALGAVEHAYAPAYAPAVSPLVQAAWVAENQRQGLQGLSPLAAAEGRRVLDVRLDEERENLPWPGAHLALALESLRDRLDELDESGPWLVVCQRGARAAEAARLLGQQGHQAVYLAGGMSWRRQAGAVVAAKE